MKKLHQIISSAPDTFRKRSLFLETEPKHMTPKEVVGGEVNNETILAVCYTVLSFKMM